MFSIIRIIYIAPLPRLHWASSTINNSTLKIKIKTCNRKINKIDAFLTEINTSVYCTLVQYTDVFIHIH